MDNDFFKFAAGELIGEGCSRSVYDWKLNDKYVLKVAKGFDGIRANIVENEIWDEVYYTQYQKWFAECVSISECGKYLIQLKAEQGRTKDYPIEIPTFLGDVQKRNYGWIGKNFVCFDYGFTVLTKGFTKKTKKVIWV